MTSNFQYPPFTQPASQIRLVNIAPGPPGSPLRCALSVVSLKPDPPPYLAISYTWGPPTDTTTIIIDQQPMTVRQSCYNALNTMRRHGLGGSSAPVWIDAICINQTDTAEKSFQVAMMGSIYHGAISVASCLECGDSLSLMRNLYPMLDQPDNDLVFESWQAAVYSVLDNAYFTRMWIVQEIGLAKDIRLYSYSTDDFLTWTELETQAYNWRGRMLALKRYPKTSNDGDLERALKELADTRTEMGTRKDNSYRHHQIKRALTLTGLMSSHLRRRCEDPRDKIYAILPMLEHAGGFDVGRTVVPDYTKSPMEVLEEYVRAIRFPTDKEARNSISTGFELWTGVKTFQSLVECFRPRIPESHLASFWHARRLRAGLLQQSQTIPPPPSNYLGTHFVGLAMRVTCSCPSGAGLEYIQPRPRFFAVWSGLPEAVITLGNHHILNSWEAPETFDLVGYYPCVSKVQLQERCGCRNQSCPGKRPKREMYIHPEDLLALVFHNQNGHGGQVIDTLTTVDTRSFVRMWDPDQQQPDRSTTATSLASSVLAHLGRTIRRHMGGRGGARDV